MKLTDPDDHAITEIPRGVLISETSQEDVVVDEVPEENNAEVLIPQEGQVVDVTVPGVILRFGDLHFPAALALEALARAGKQSSGTLPGIGDIRSQEEYLQTMGQQHPQLYTGPLPLMEEQVWGYKRNTSEDVLPDNIPVLAGIGETKAIPGIIDPVQHRVFADGVREGPRLIACTKPGTALPSRLYIAEFPPTSVLSDVRGNRYQLNVPYIVAAYVPAFGTLYIRCRPRPIAPGDTQTYSFPFPHIDEGGKVCIHLQNIKDLKNVEPLEAMVQVMTAYWHTGYAYYLTTHGMGAIPIAGNHTHHHTQATPDVERNFKWWEEQSFETILGLQYTQAETVEALGGRLNRGTQPLEYFVDQNAITAADQRAAQTEQQIQEMAQVAQR